PARLPHSYLCFTPPAEPIAIGPLPALARDAVTFGCFNNLVKITGAVVDLWSALLASVPRSRLFLKTALLGAAEMRDGIADQFAARGIARDRLVLEPASP